ALFSIAWALHDVEIVVHKENLRRASSIFFVNFDERVNAALIVRLGEVPVKIILPENTWITLMRKDECVRQELVVNNGTVAHDVVILDEGHSLAGPVPHQNPGLRELTQTESVAVAQIAQAPAQRKIKCADWIVRPCIRFVEPIIDSAFAIPAFSDRVRLETCAAAQCAHFLNRTDHPTAVTLDHVVAESVETDFFQKPASVVDELCVNQRSAMAQIRHVTECCSVPRLVLARMKTFPVAREFAARWRELCPPPLAVDRIQFLSIRAAVMIEHQIRVHLQSRRMSRLDQVE